MAGAGYKLFNSGDVLTAAQVNTYLQEQAVMRFANATARTTALSGVLAEGMVSYLDDTNKVQVYNGSAWVDVSGDGDITEVIAGTGISGGGTSGAVTITNTVATTFDAKGDLVVGTGADTFAKLTVGGTNGHVLQIDSSTATGLKWAAAASGGFTFSTWSNIFSAGVTVGNGTTDAFYATSGDLVFAYFAFKFGSTTSFTGTPIISLPVTAHSSTDRVWGPSVQCLDAGTAVFQGFWDFNDDSNDTRAIPVVGKSDGTYLQASYLSSTVPFTWTTNDTLFGTLIYRKA